MFVTAVVAGTGVTLRVFVGHGRAERIKDGAGGDVLRGNEDDRLALPLNLITHDGCHLGIRVDQRFLEHLENAVSDSPFFFKEGFGGDSRFVPPCGAEKASRRPWLGRSRDAS